MSKIFQHLADPALPGAIEANFAEEMACFGRTLPGGELHQDYELTWFLTRPSLFNGVLLTNFAHDDNAYISARITETCDYFKAHQVEEMGWSTGPGSSPPDLASHLVAHDFTYSTSTDCMVLEVSRIHNDISVPAGLVITEVLDEAAMQTKISIEKEGFNATDELAQAYHTVYLKSGFGPDMSWHHYIGWLYDKPVAISSLLLHAGIAGIYGIATIPDARRRGAGTAITLHTVREAARLGYHIVTLSPTDMSVAIYRHLGFMDFCKILHFNSSFSDE